MNIIIAPKNKQKIDSCLEIIKSVLTKNLRNEKESWLALGEEDLSPTEAAHILGFSRQHVDRLINSGKLQAITLSNSNHKKISIDAIIEFQNKRLKNTQKIDRIVKNLQL